MDKIYDIEINELKKLKINIKEDKNSLQFLINTKLTQSEKIKLGIKLEELINNIIKKHTQWKFVKKIVDKREADSLFELNDTIIYAEFKCNLNLDTEKSKSTIEKCNFIANNLKIQYEKYKVIFKLVSLRYLEKKDIPKNIIYKFKSINDNICGINEFLKLYNLPIFKNYEIYSIFLNKLCIKIFNH
jgi:hypothetical protein